MAPSLHQREGEDTYKAAGTVRSEASGPNGVVLYPWMLVVIIVGAIVVTLLVVFVVLFISKRRQRIPQEDQVDPPVDPLGLNDTKRKRMSMTDRHAAEEIERAMMIRKSIQSRTSSRLSQATDYMFEELDQEDREHPSHRNDDDKAFESGQQPIPGVHNTQIGVHPALLPRPQFPISQPPRAMSPIRNPQPSPLYMSSR